MELFARKIGEGSPIYSVSIHSSGSPGTNLGTLTNPSLASTGLEQSVRFTAPGAGIDLDAGETYFVKASGAGRKVFISFTSRNGEDPDGAAGWTIADERGDGSTHSFKMAIYGYELGGRVRT